MSVMAKDEVDEVDDNVGVGDDLLDEEKEVETKVIKTENKENVIEVEREVLMPYLNNPSSKKKKTKPAKPQPQLPTKPKTQSKIIKSTRKQSFTRKKLYINP